MTYTDLAQSIESITPANGLKEKLELAKKEKPRYPMNMVKWKK